MKKHLTEIAQIHSWYFEKSFSSFQTYEQFINWLRVEFYCFLQNDQDALLTIYFPNGKVKVKHQETTDSLLISKITIESKCAKIGLKMKKKVSEFLSHIENYYNYSQSPVLN